MPTRLPLLHSAGRAALFALLAMAMGASQAAPGTENLEQSRTAGSSSFFGPLPTMSLPGAAATADMAGRLRARASDMVVTAMSFLGVPYQRGGTGDSAGFDCSGFTRHIFETTLGRLLPRRAEEQAQAPGLIAVQKSELQPGDLVFFNTLRRTFSHVGIYIGEGKFIHAPRPGGEVRVEEMGLAYWRHRFTGARRAEPVPQASAAASATAVAGMAAITPR